MYTYTSTDGNHTGHWMLIHSYILVVSSHTFLTIPLLLDPTLRYVLLTWLSMTGSLIWPAQFANTERLRGVVHEIRNVTRKLVTMENVYRSGMESFVTVKAPQIAANHPTQCHCLMDTYCYRAQFLALIISRWHFEQDKHMQR